MTRAEKAKKIGAILDRLFPQPDIPLGHRDPFTLLVAVVLSAQTTDAQVNRVTPALFRRASNPAALARMPEHEVLKLIRSCGLAPSKARRLKQMAQAIVDQYGGEIPRDIDDLKKLFPREEWAKRHLQIIYFGREYCPARNHDMRACPICSWAARGARRAE